jgi:hypothetical protein
VLIALLVLSCSFSHSLSVEGSFKKPLVPRPLVGSIRWDGWIGPVPGYDVGLQVETSLGPQRWHTLLPFFAEELSRTEVRIRANTQAGMDQEIVYAHRAGLDYWAFVGVLIRLGFFHTRISAGSAEANSCTASGIICDDCKQRGRGVSFLLGPDCRK